MKWLVTGVCGFIGSNFARMLADKEQTMVVGVDKLTYAANPRNIEDLDVKVYRSDISDAGQMADVFNKETDIDVVVNFAAESHVDRSIESSKEFVLSNILGVQVLLDLALKYDFRFVQVSSDEVYGSVEQQGGVAFHEDMRLHANSPYSASKAAADMLVQSYFMTHCIDAVITRCSNNYGPYQNPEKMLPKCILNSLKGEKIPVYGDGRNVRDWIHVSDHCRGIYKAVTNGREGDIYNFGGGNPMENVDLVLAVLKEVGARPELIEYVCDRKGHDRTYKVGFDKAKADLWWKPEKGFDEGLRETVRWYSEHEDWFDIR